MNFTEQVDYLKSRLNLQSDEAVTRIGTEINRMYRRVMASVGLANAFRRVQNDYSVATSTRLQTIPDVEKVISVKVKDTGSVVNPFLEEITYDEMLVTVPLAGNVPTMFAVKRWNVASVTLMFNCTFDTAQTLTIEAEENTSTLSGTQEPAFPESYHDVIWHGVLENELRKKEKLQAARDEKIEYERMLGELRLYVASRGMMDLVQGKRNVSDTFQSDLNLPTSTAGGGGGGSSTTDDTLQWYVNAMDPNFGCFGDGVGDDTVAFQAAVNASKGKTLFLPYGKTFRLTGNIIVPVGDTNAVRILGQNWTTYGIVFDGAAVDKGFHFLGTSTSSYDYSEGIENVRIMCTNGAKRGVTFENLNHPEAKRVYVHGAAGSGIQYVYTLVGRLEHCFIHSCGSATEAPVEVDNSTTWVWDQTRISDCNNGVTGLGGLLIDRTAGFTILGGNIETTRAIPLRFASKTEGTRGVTNGSIVDLDIENPGTTMYAEFGYGWTGAASTGVQAVDLINIAATIAGSTDVRYGIKLKNCADIHFQNANWGLTGGSKVAYHWLEGNTNIGTRIGVVRRAFGNTTPWVQANSLTQQSASPQAEWNQSEANTINLSPAELGGSATPDLRILSTQGGLYRNVKLTQGGAQNVNQFLFGANCTGNFIFVYTADANTTFKHANAAGADGELRMAGGVDVVSVAGKTYVFWCDGNFWYEVSGTSMAAMLTDAWTDYGASSTVVGWAASPTVHIWVKKMGTVGHVLFNISGTSNSATTTFTLPWNLKTLGHDTYVTMAQFTDNGVASATPGFIKITSGANLVQLFKDATLTAFTNVNAKQVVGEFFVPLNP